jgi:hypothetical protein
MRYTISKTLRFPDDTMIDAATRKEHGRLRQRESAARSDAKIRARLTCGECHNSYARQYLYEAHLFKCGVDGPEYPFQCDYGVAYQSKCALQAHQHEAHEGEYTGVAILERKRHHECDQCPGSSHSQFEGLRRHQREAHSVYSGEV